MTPALALAPDEPPPPEAPAVPEWATGVADQPTKVAAIRFVCDRMPSPLGVDDIRAILAAAGMNTSRTYASGHVNAWRKEHGLTQTGEHPVLSPTVLAALDASADATPPALEVPALTPGRAPDATTPAAPDATTDAAPVLPDASVSTALAVPDATTSTALAVPDASGVSVLPTPDASSPAVRAEGITAARTFLQGKSPLFRRGFYVLAAFVTLLLVAVIIAPISLSAHNIVAWADDPHGLNLEGVWPYVVFFALDAAAAVCVLIVVLFAMLGRHAREFAILVWAIAGASAYASYSHGLSVLDTLGVKDAWWAMPLFALSGVTLFELVMRRARQLAQEGTGRRADVGVAFPLSDWLPGIGATRETYGAWRLARLDGITSAAHARRAYRKLCPTGSVRVLKALRERDAQES